MNSEEMQELIKKIKRFAKKLNEEEPICFYEASSTPIGNGELPSEDTELLYQILANASPEMIEEIMDEAKTLLNL